MVCTKLHSCINTFNICYTISIDANSFIDHRNKNSVNNETSSFLNLYRCLADRNRDFFDLLNSFFRCIQTCNNFDQFHNWCWVKEMHTNNWSVHTGTDFCDRK